MQVAWDVEEFAEPSPMSHHKDECPPSYVSLVDGRYPRKPDSTRWAGKLAQARGARLSTRAHELPGLWLRANQQRRMLIRWQTADPDRGIVNHPTTTQRHVWTGCSSTSRSPDTGTGSLEAIWSDAIWSNVQNLPDSPRTRRGLAGVNDGHNMLRG